MTDMQWYIVNEVVVIFILLSMICIFCLTTYLIMRKYVNNIKETLKETTKWLLLTFGSIILILSIGYFADTLKIIKIKDLINNKNYNIWYNGEILNGKICDAHKILESNYELDNEKRLIIINDGVVKYDK